VAAGGEVRLVAAPGHGCRFLPEGVELWSPEEDRETVPWSRIQSVTVDLPRRWYLVRVLAAYAFAMAVQGDADVPSRRATVFVADRWGNGPSRSLGRIGPFRRRDARALNGLLSRLERERRLPDLADPEVIAHLWGRPLGLHGKLSGARPEDQWCC
jgi:hypothetical protein